MEDNETQISFQSKVEMNLKELNFFYLLIFTITYEFLTNNLSFATSNYNSFGEINFIDKGGSAPTKMGNLDSMNIVITIVIVIVIVIVMRVEAYSEYSYLDLSKWVDQRLNWS